mgnify:CR=1 FL=1
MKFKRIMIAATKSGSGKTMITCALLQILKNMGQQAVSYKCGPDYIDPLFHKKVLGIPSKNLDTFFTNEEETKELLLKNRREEDFAILEGVMGLYDGLGGVREEGSSYHLAKITKTPIVLVVDAKGMGRSIISLIAGFLAYDKDHLIRGIILNRMSKSYYEIIKTLIEEELNISVLGYFPEHKELRIESRYLGLIMPDELGNIKKQLSIAAEELQKTVSVERIMQIAEEARNLEWNSTIYNPYMIISEKAVIAVARDEAFSFYYEDNLLMLQEYGAKLEYFSPLHDKELPDGCNGILIGGGYPELYAEELSKNSRMLTVLKQSIEKGMPIVAECGGFMYLHSAIVDKEKKSYAMVGIIPELCYDTGKLVRFGYIELEENQSNFLPNGERIRGHEFHYFDSMNNGGDCLAIKPTVGKKYPCVMAGENYWYGFPHLYYPSNPAFAKNFVDKASNYRERS